jgi:4-amino-4-deoxy-L-arabinose transferase-like glycosyltransferase
MLMERVIEWEKLIPLLIPILLIQFGLQIYALVDLYRQPSVRGSKVLWAVVIILGEILGPIIYFIFARRED